MRIVGLIVFVLLGVGNMASTFFDVLDVSLVRADFDRSWSPAAYPERTTQAD